jgi:hypothetical protein
MKYEYVGKIPNLQGKTAELRPVTEADVESTLLIINTETTVMAQFDDIRLKHGSLLMGFRWHFFPKADFQPVGQKPIF